MFVDLPNFSQGRVLVFGDVMLDRYWTGDTSRISPEAPVPVVRVKNDRVLPGGAGNVARNIQSLGSQAFLIGAIGEDEAGDALCSSLDQEHVSHALIRSQANNTITKLRVICRDQQLVRLDFEDTFVALDLESLHQTFTTHINNCDVVILSDYGKGTLVDPQTLIRHATAAKVPVFVDPKGIDFTRYRGATLLTPNRKEFEAVFGTCHSQDELVSRGLKAIDELSLQALLITRDEHGMTLLQRDLDPLHIPARVREVFDVTGAGDTVIATLAAAVASGASIENSVVLANAAAGIVVSKLGAATVSRSELQLELEEKKHLPRGVFDESELLSLVQLAKSRGEKIVMTNGCFDILHIGHITYLKQAKALGDRLIVAINSDESVKKLKGNSRPINSLLQRQEMLSALESVDWVVEFCEDTPQRIIEKLLPDILVKGGDYRVDQIAGHEAVIHHGGEVKTLGFVPGHSTSKLIETILGAEA